MSILWTIIIGFVAGIIAKLIHPGVGELPIVVEPRAILPAVKFRTSHALRRKQADGLKCGALKRATRIHQDAIHVEDNYRQLVGHRTEIESAAQRVVRYDGDSSCSSEDSAEDSRVSASSVTESDSVSISSESEDHASPATGGGTAAV